VNHCRRGLRTFDLVVKCELHNILREFWGLPKQGFKLINHVNNI
jgi:hypothetical protein